VNGNSAEAPQPTILILGFGPFSQNSRRRATAIQSGKPKHAKPKISRQEHPREVPVLGANDNKQNEGKKSKKQEEEAICTIWPIRLSEMGSRRGVKLGASWIQSS
jgi:hypothetical protein